MTLDNRHAIARPYWARPGIVTAAAADDGGGADDREDDDLDDEDDEEDDDPDAGKTEEELRAELKAARATAAQLLSSRKSERDKRRQAQKRAAELEGKIGKGAASDDEDSPEARAAALEAARREERERADRKVKLAEARGALRAAGIDPARLDRALGLIDLGELDVDDDGNVDGIDDAIETLKGDLPELFAPKTRQRRNVAGRERRDDESGGQPKSAAQRHAEAILGSR